MTCIVQCIAGHMHFDKTQFPCRKTFIPSTWRTSPKSTSKKCFGDIMEEWKLPLRTPSTAYSAPSPDDGNTAQCNARLVRCVSPAKAGINTAEIIAARMILFIYLSLPQLIFTMAISPGPTETLTELSDATLSFLPERCSATEATCRFFKSILILTRLDSSSF